MSLFDAFAGVKKNGFQIYKKNCLLIDKELCDRQWSNLEPFFSEVRSDYNLVYYLGDRGLNTSYTKLYCSKDTYNERVQYILRGGWNDRRF